MIQVYAVVRDGDGIRLTGGKNEKSDAVEKV